MLEKVYSYYQAFVCVIQQNLMILDDNNILEEKLGNLEAEIQNRDNEVTQLKQSLKEKIDQIKEQEFTIGK